MRGSDGETLGRGRAIDESKRNSRAYSFGRSPSFSRILHGMVDMRPDAQIESPFKEDATRRLSLVGVQKKFLNKLAPSIGRENADRSGAAPESSAIML